MSDTLVSVPPVELMSPSFETAASGKNKRTGMDLLRPHQAMQGSSLSEKKHIFALLSLPKAAQLREFVCLKPADRDGTPRSFSAAAKTKVAAALTSIRTKPTDYLIAADTGCLSGATNMISWDRDGANQPCAVVIRGAGMSIFTLRSDVVLDGH